MATLSDDLRPKRASTLESLRIQSRVIKALILRELHTRYGRENIGYLWLILEPMLLAMIVGLIHARGGNIHQGDVKPVPLSVIGYCNFMLFRSIFNRGEGAIEQNLSLFYHRTIKPLDVLIARALLETAGTWVAFVILMSAAIGLDMTHLPARPAWLLVGMFSMLWFAFAGSLVIAGLTYERRTLGRLVHPFTYLMMPLSGAFFTMSMLPGPLRNIFLWIPLAHIFEILRYGWFHSSNHKYFDAGYVLVWLLGLSLMGLILLSQARKRIHMP
jgi:capsular polysaccharide transport system permease protein